jgi:hypothetical protein
MTAYTDKELRDEAKRAIRDNAKTTKQRTRYLGFEIRIHDHGTTLFAHGERIDDLPTPERFSIAIAI